MFFLSPIKKGGCRLDYSVSRINTGSLNNHYFSISNSNRYEIIERHFQSLIDLSLLIARHPLNKKLKYQFNNDMLNISSKQITSNNHLSK